MTQQHTDLRTVAAIQTATSNVDFFDAYSGGSGRTFCLRCSDPSVEVVVEAGDSATDSGAGVPVAVLGGGHNSSFGGINGSSYLRYRVSNPGNGATPVVWVDAPADVQGATGAAGTPGALTLSGSIITADPAPAVIDTEYLYDPTTPFTFTFPAIGPGNHGHRVGGKNTTTSTGNLTATPTGSDTMDGGATQVLSGSKLAWEYQADNTPTPKVWRKTK